MTNLTGWAHVRKRALLNTTALITLDRATENYFPHFKGLFDETLTLDFIIREEIVFEGRIRDALLKGYLTSYAVEENDMVEAEGLLQRWKELALADALIITIGSKLKRKGEVFVITDDLIERKVAENNGLTTLWTSTLAIIFNYLGFTSLTKFIEDVEKRRVLWISKEVLKALKIFESRETMKILMNLYKTPRSYEDLLSRHPNKLINALTNLDIITIKEESCSLNERHDVTKIIPNIAKYDA